MAYGFNNRVNGWVDNVAQQMSQAVATAPMLPPQANPMANSQMPGAMPPQPVSPPQANLQAFQATQGIHTQPVMPNRWPGARQNFATPTPQGFAAHPITPRTY